MVEEAQYGRRKKVEMIEAGTILAGAGILVLVASLLARRPARVPATLR
jgi:hypothetical protein